MSESFNLSTEPLTIGGTLDSGAKLLRSGFKSVLPVALVSMVPYALISTAFSALIAPAEEDPERVAEVLMPMGILMLLMYPAMILMMGAVIKAFVGQIRGVPVSAGAALLAGLKYCLPLTVLMVAYIFAVGLASLALLIPGIILAINFCLFLYVPFMEEDVSPWRSLHRSHQLVWKGNWWRTVTILTVVGVIAMALTFVFYLGLGVLAAVQVADDGGTSLVYMAAEFFVTLLSMSIYMPIVIAMGLVLYNDLKIRKQGVDLADRLDALEPDPESAKESSS